MKRIIAGLAAVGVLSTGLGASASTGIDVSNIRLEFLDANEIGRGAAVGFSHRYTNVMPGSGHTVDVRVTVLEIDNLESQANSAALATTPDLKLAKLDDDKSDLDADKHLNLEIDVFDTPAADDTGSVLLRFEFLEPGSLVPVTLTNVSLYVKDIDINQFLEVSGVSGYRLNSTTQLSVKTNSDDPAIPAGAFRFVSPAANTNPPDPNNWAELTMIEATYLDLRFGADVIRTAAFAIDFTKTDWTSASPVDVFPPTPNFQVSYDGNNSSGGTPPSAQSSSSKVTIAGNTGNLERAGYEFIGWNMSADGTGRVLDPATEFRPTSNVTLYAQWRAVATTTTISPTTTVSPSSTKPGAVDTPTQDSVDGSEEERSLPATGMSIMSMLFAATGALFVGLRLRRVVPGRT